MTEEIKKTPLMEKYEKETERKAIWQGRITNGFKEWKVESGKKGREKNKTEFKGKEANPTPLPQSDDESVYVVENNRGQYVREYTPEIHGDKRKKLAEEFAKKIGGNIIKKNK